jgi:hypothetical protein
MPVEPAIPLSPPAMFGQSPCHLTINLYVALRYLST